MAEKTEEKKRTYKDFDDAEKYQFWKTNLKKVGKTIVFGTISIGAGFAIYKAGQYAGAYDLAEKIYNEFPEVRDQIMKLDPAFFTTIKN